MTFGEKVDRIMQLAGLAPDVAAKVAMELPDGEPTERGIEYALAQLNLTPETPAPPVTLEHALAGALRSLQLASDPDEVKALLYRECARALPVRAAEDEDGAEIVDADGCAVMQDRVHMPRIGRAPKGSAFHTDEVRELIAQLPENVRLLIGSVDLANGSMTITLYDQANDVDRTIGPIDLTIYKTGEEFGEAINVLLSRLPRVLASDWN